MGPHGSEGTEEAGAAQLCPPGGQAPRWSWSLKASPLAVRAFGWCGLAHAAHSKAVPSPALATIPLLMQPRSL